MVEFLFWFFRPMMRKDNYDAGGSRGGNNVQNDLAHLAETIAQATKLIKAAGLTPGNLSKI